MTKTISKYVILIVFFFISLSFMQDYSLSKSINRGKEVYSLYCQSCHMEDGKGQKGSIPPLAASDFFKNPTKDLIEIILKGQNGKIIVNSSTYEVPMLPLNYLTDEQISDVINFVRNSWGNRTKIVVRPQDVAKLRH